MDKKCSHHWQIVRESVSAITWGLTRRISQQGQNIQCEYIPHVNRIIAIPFTV